MQQKQVVVLTGTSSGIGREILTHFLEKTDLTVVSLSRKKPALFGFEERFYHLNFDLSKDELYAELIVFLQKNNIVKVDFLINNAGFLANASFLNTDPVTARKVFDVNFFGAAKVIHTLYPLLQNSGKSHVVNIGSMGGFQGSAKFSGLSYYSASKAALASLAEVLAEEFKPDNIHINTLSLGAVQTEMLNAAFPGYEAPVSAKEMAGFIVDFSLHGHRFFNGKNIPVAVSVP